MISKKKKTVKEHLSPIIGMFWA